MVDLAESVKAEELREQLEALRDYLAAEMQSGVCCKACGGVVSSPTAPLAKQLRDVLTQLSQMPKAKGSVSGDLKNQRARRQARVAGGSAGGQQQRRRSGQARS